MTRQELIDYCLSYLGSYEDYPFDSITDPGAWTVMRHSANKKSFALIYERGGELCVNLKCDPVEADLLRQLFAEVQPAYHMNKTHWNTVILGGDVSDEELMRQIGISYNLIKPKRRRRRLVVPVQQLLDAGATINLGNFGEETVDEVWGVGGHQPDLITGHSHGDSAGCPPV